MSGAIFADNAVEMARAGWEVSPLQGKIPAIAGGRGVLDATVDLDVIAQWARDYRRANIGARVPEALIIIDTDARHGGTQAQTLAAAR